MNNSALALPKWVRGPIITTLYGFTDGAIAKKRQRGVWIYGKIWKRAPDKSIMYSPKEIDRWIDSGR